MTTQVRSRRCPVINAPVLNDQVPNDPTPHTLRSVTIPNATANLTWPMVLDARGRIGPTIELHDRAAKRGSGRSIPLHPKLKMALIQLRQRSATGDPVILSERGGKMTANSVINWFGSLYRSLDLQGCSSHSGRRTFITNAARNVHRVGGSIRDVQQLAGHRSIAMTQRYIEGDTTAKRRLVAML